MPRNTSYSGRAAIGCTLLGAALLPFPACAKSFQVLYTFTGGSDGGFPDSPLIADASGNLYGTTNVGGAGNGYNGFGTLFRLAPDGTLTVLHTFDGTNGSNPSGAIVMDKKGNIYGTTERGGANNVWGVVFKLTPGGEFKVLHSFGAASDGADPKGGVIRDRWGNLYGTTFEGGATGGGTVFEVARDGTETVLHSFNGFGDGLNPVGSVAADAAGNLYGTTEYGGLDNYCGGHGCGTVFTTDTSGNEKVLYSFVGTYQSGTDGEFPWGTPSVDAAGNVYGTTLAGGANGAGTVFELSPGGTETVLYSFTGGRDGEQPEAGLYRDSAGNLYGTNSGLDQAYGAAFKVGPKGTEVTLHTFSGGNNGANPTTDLAKAGIGYLVGTALKGGQYGWGVVFKVKE